MQTFKWLQALKSVALGSKFYLLLPDKENTGDVQKLWVLQLPFYQNIVLLLKQETHDEDLNEPMVDESSMQSEFISDSFATEQGK